MKRYLAISACFAITCLLGDATSGREAIEPLPSVNSLVESFNSARIHPNSCGQSSSFLDLTNENLDCPAYLIQMAEKDRVAGIFDRECPQDLTKFMATRPEILEQVFARDPLMDLNSPTPLISLPHCRSIANLSNRKREVQINDAQTRLVIGEYFQDMNRLSNAVQSATESIASIDSLLGDSLLSDSECGDLRVTKSIRQCINLRGCHPAGGLRNLALAYAEDYPVIQKLEEKSANLSARAALIGMSTSYAPQSPSSLQQSLELSKQRQQTEEQIALIKSLHPGVEGKAFNKVFNPKFGNFEHAFREQLVATRSALRVSLDRYRTATECLNSRTSRSSCKNLEGILDTTPPLARTELKSSLLDKEARTKATLIDAALAEVDCHKGIRSTKKERSDAIEDFAIGAGLTIATAGLSSVATGAKVALAISKSATQATQATARVIQFANRASLARAALFGVNAGTAVSGAYDRIQNCDGQWKEFSEPSPSRSGAEGAASACPGNQGYSGPTFMGNYRGCIIAAALATSVDLLPLAPEVAKKFGDSMRIANAIELLGNRKLGDAERKAIIAAHYVGLGEVGKDGITRAGSGNYSRTQISQKARILDQAGFNKNEIRRLMEGGIVGQAGFFSSLVGKIRTATGIRAGGPEGAELTLREAESAVKATPNSTTYAALDKAKAAFTREVGIEGIITGLKIDQESLSYTRDKIRHALESGLIRFARTNLEGFQKIVAQFRSLNENEMNAVRGAIFKFDSTKLPRLGGVEKNLEEVLIATTNGEGDFRLALQEFVERADQASIGDLKIVATETPRQGRIQELLSVHFSREAIQKGSGEVTVDVTQIPKEKRNLLRQMIAEIKTYDSELMQEKSLQDSKLFNFNSSREEIGRLRKLNPKEYVPDDLVSFQSRHGYKTSGEWQIIDIKDSNFVESGGSRRIYRAADGRSVLESLNHEGKVTGTEVIIARDPLDRTKGASFFSYNEQGNLVDDFTLHFKSGGTQHRVIMSSKGCATCHSNKIGSHTQIFPGVLPARSISTKIVPAAEGIHGNQ